MKKEKSIRKLIFFVTSQSSARWLFFSGQVATCPVADTHLADSDLWKGKLWIWICPCQWALLLNYRPQQLKPEIGGLPNSSSNWNLLFLFLIILFWGTDEEALQWPEHCNCQARKTPKATECLERPHPTHPLPAHDHVMRTYHPSPSLWSHTVCSLARTPLNLSLWNSRCPTCGLRDQLRLESATWNKFLSFPKPGSFETGFSWDKFIQVCSATVLANLTRSCVLLRPVPLVFLRMEHLALRCTKAFLSVSGVTGWDRSLGIIFTLSKWGG